MKETPTSAVTIKDLSGNVHALRLDFAAKRRIMRRVRALQLTGEMTKDLASFEALDSIEFAYLTAYESRTEQNGISENAWLMLFDEKELITVTGELWARYRSSDVPNPTPEEVNTSSNPN